MRIATLQFAPKLGDVDGNIQKANELLRRGKCISLDGKTKSESGIGLDSLRPDILVLPELALTGTSDFERKHPALRSLLHTSDKGVPSIIRDSRLTAWQGIIFPHWMQSNHF